MSVSLRTTTSEVISDTVTTTSYSKRKDLGPCQVFADLFKYCFNRSKELTDSIYLDGLVGGMILNYYTDTNEICEDALFNIVFFLICVLHSVSFVVKGIENKYDNTWFSAIQYYTMQIIRILQFLTVVALNVAVIHIVSEVDQWTHDKQKDPQKKYCMAYDFHIGEAALIYHWVYGTLILMTWVIMWWADRKDKEHNNVEQMKWQEEERKQKGTLCGKIKEVILMVSDTDRSFYNVVYASIFLAVGIGLPKDSCIRDVQNSFLAAGVVQTCSGVLSHLIGYVGLLAAQDGIITKAGNRFIQCLRYGGFLLFMADLSVFAVLIWTFRSHSSHIDYKDITNDHYCDSHTFTLMCLWMGVYAGVIILKFFKVGTEAVKLYGKSPSTDVAPPPSGIQIV